LFIADSTSKFCNPANIGNGADIGGISFCPRYLQWHIYYEESAGI